MKVKLQNQFLSSQFSGTWTPSFFEFTGKLSKIQEDKHTPEFDPGRWIKRGTKMSVQTFTLK